MPAAQRAVQNRPIKQPAKAGKPQKTKCGLSACCHERSLSLVGRLHESTYRVDTDAIILQELHGANVGADRQGPVSGIAVVVPGLL